MVTSHLRKHFPREQQSKILVSVFFCAVMIWRRGQDDKLYHIQVDSPSRKTYGRLLLLLLLLL
jgi:hypothetical protein